MQIEKVLIIDDDLFAQKAAKAALSPVAKSFDFAENGEQGFEKYHQYEPDLVILDINMPGMSGTEFLEKYSKSIYNPCPVVVTGDDTLDVFKTRFAQENCVVLLKPYMPPDLIKYANMAVNLQRI